MKAVRFEYGGLRLRASHFAQNDSGIDSSSKVNLFMEVRIWQLKQNIV